MKRLVLPALAAAATLSFALPGKAAQIAIACGGVGIELQLCRSGAEAWAQQTGNQVKIVSTPNSSNERLALFQQLLAAHAADVDVFQIDVIWPGILGEHFIDLSKYSGGAEWEHFEAIVRNDTIDNALKAMPWFVDAGLLYYRKDLLSKYQTRVPRTWQELTDTAQRIEALERKSGNGRFWGFVWQGRAYEGLTCNALEWIYSFGGGTIVDATGEVTIANPKAAAAVDLAAGWVGSITPEGVLNYAEEDARGVFQSGNALFMRNWPYAWALANGADSPVRGKVGIAPLPGGDPGGTRAGTLGGWQLAVSRYSRNPAIAASLVLYLTGAQEQKRRAIEGSFNPTIKALYRDPEILSANPFYRDIYSTFTDAVARPSGVLGKSYNQVSTEFWEAVHATLAKNGSAAENLATLQRRLERLHRHGW
jgi:trehalose/maltose transport system substrate-binding protein